SARSAKEVREGVKRSAGTMRFQRSSATDATPTRSATARMGVGKRTTKSKSPAMRTTQSAPAARWPARWVRSDARARDRVRWSQRTAGRNRAVVWSMRGSDEADEASAQPFEREERGDDDEREGRVPEGLGALGDEAFAPVGEEFAQPREVARREDGAAGLVGEAREQGVVSLRRAHLVVGERDVDGRRE